MNKRTVLMLGAFLLWSSVSFAKQVTTFQGEIDFAQGQFWSTVTPAGKDSPSVPFTIRSQFYIKNNTVFLTSFQSGQLTGYGLVDLYSPYKLEIHLNLNAVNLDDFLRFWVRDKSYPSQGDVFGKIDVSGDPENLYLKGSLQSYKGFITKLSYDEIYLNVEGTYPNVHISRSRVSQSFGLSYALEGPFDLSDKKNYKKQIKALTLAPVVTDTKSGREWTLKEKNEDGSSTAFKYYLREEDGLPMTSQDSAVIGVEHAVEF